MNIPLVSIFRPPTSEALVANFLFTTGTRKAFAASGDFTKDVLPRSSMHLEGKYFPSTSKKNLYIGLFPTLVGDTMFSFFLDADV